MEINEANCLHSLARIKFMGARDKPRKTFFLLVKAKQQWEAMPILIIDDDTTLKDKGEILEEVELFYSKLCTTIGSSQAISATREELLSMVRSHVTHEQRMEIDTNPNSAKVKKIMKKIPRDQWDDYGSLASTLELYTDRLSKHDFEILEDRKFSPSNNSRSLQVDT